jgi:hypothetical protein
MWKKLNDLTYLLLSIFLSIYFFFFFVLLTDHIGVECFMPNVSFVALKTFTMNVTRAKGEKSEKVAREFQKACDVRERESVD